MKATRDLRGFTWPRICGDRRRRRFFFFFFDAAAVCPSDFARARGEMCPCVRTKCVWGEMYKGIWVGFSFFVVAG